MTYLKTNNNIIAINNHTVIKREDNMIFVSYITDNFDRTVLGIECESTEEAKEKLEIITKEQYNKSSNHIIGV